MNDETASYLDGIARDTRLDEGAAGVKRVMVELHRHGRLGGRELARYTRFSPATISVLLDKLSTDGILHRDKHDGAKYTARGMQFVQDALGIRSLAGRDCTWCDATGFEVDENGIHQRIHDMSVRVASMRPDADVTLDQAKCLPVTIARRLLLMHAHHAFDGTRVLFVGDDDFMSVAASSTEFHEEYFVPAVKGDDPPFTATVMDIDTRILDAVKETTRGKGFVPVDTRHHDVREPLPGDLQGAFDVAFTDPPYTLAGATLFLSRAAAALQGRPGSMLFFSFGHLPATVARSVHEIILSMGFVIERIIPAFNKYEGGNIIGNASAMLVLSATGTLEPTIPANEAMPAGSIYTAGDGRVS